MSEMADSRKWLRAIIESLSIAQLADGAESFHPHLDTALVLVAEAAPVGHMPACSPVNFWSAP